LTVFLLNFNEIQLTLRRVSRIVVSYSYHNNLEIFYRDMENLTSPNPIPVSTVTNRNTITRCGG